MSFLLPEASTQAFSTDMLIAALLVTSTLVLGLVFFLMWLYFFRYRASNPLNRGEVAEKTFRFEISWTAATLLVFFALFVWGADLYLHLFEPPANALRIYVVGKQWMWKVEHPGGQREINALHIPIDRPIELVMTSEDVIHDFSVPAFRVKRDVLPGRYETLWFTPSHAGTYHLFCTQYCGTDHSSMVGEIHVLPAPDYAAWLARAGSEGGLAAEGRVLFMRYGCSGCHQVDRSSGGTVRAPPLVGLYGSPVPLSDGSVVTAGEQYLRDSVLQPSRQVVAGYPDIMPSFAGVISEEDLIRIIAYVKSLSGATEPPQ
jgi:cytochrome c oxidase subunit 2